MNDDQPAAQSKAEAEENNESAAIIAADDTGMVRSEVLLVEADMNDHLESPQP